MSSSSSLSRLLLVLSQVGMGIFALLIAYFLVMAGLSFLGLLPDHLDASFEIPVSLDKAEKYYQIQELDPRFSFHEIEIKEAHVDVRPKDRSWPQSIAYLHASLYLGFFLAILYFLSRILKNFQRDLPFAAQNTSLLRNIGYVSLGLGSYEFVLMLSVSRFFHDKVQILHGSTVKFPSLLSIDYVILFLGLVILVLAEVFKRGAELQELEEQTV